MRPAMGDGMHANAATVAGTRARVVSGRGDLAEWMTRYAAAYERVAGAALVPGSLNLLLDGPWVMGPPDVRLEAAEAGVGMGFVRCRVDEVDCLLVRTDRNDAGTGDHPRTVVEVVSTVHLRTALGLADGDEVVLEIGVP